MAKWDFRSDDERDQLNLDLDNTAQYGQWKSEELYDSFIYSNTVGYEPKITFTPTGNTSTWTLVNNTSDSVTWTVRPSTPPTQFKFNENAYIREADLYIQDTYKQHYGGGQYQATDMIIDAGHGEAFCVGNIMKYAMRYGKKNGHDRKDLLKIIHYAIIALHCLDKRERK